MWRSSQNKREECGYVCICSRINIVVKFYFDLYQQ
jgi:hypothetical protein